MPVSFRLLLAWVRLVPVKLGRPLGRSLGTLAYFFAGGLRRRALESLEIAYGAERTPSELRRLARASLGELGMTLFEFLKLPFLTDRQVLQLMPIEHVERFEEHRGKPVILISGHLGNVIVLAAALAVRGHKVSAVVRPFTSEGLRALVRLVSARFGLGVIERRGNRVGVQSLEILRRGEVLGLATDQDAGSKGVFVPFFGRPASTFLGAAQLARRQKVPILPIFSLRGPDGALRAWAEPPLEVAATGDAAADDRETTARHVALLERYVRRSPASYLWTHRRWKTQPEGPLDDSSEDAPGPAEPATPTSRPDPPPATTP